MATAALGLPVWPGQWNKNGGGAEEEMGRYGTVELTRGRSDRGGFKSCFPTSRRLFGESLEDLKNNLV